MPDLIEDAAPGNAPEFTVSEISGAVKRVIEGEFAHIRVRGEVGRVSRPRSGHVYLDLKDDRNVLSGVIWKGVTARLATQPEEGMEVIATGRLTTFGGQSKYQIVIEDIAPAGIGALMAMLEKRKAALAAEGLFAPERKKPLPYLPEVIGVVTSPSGAVIRDILHRLRDRFPRKVLIWPVAVQGAKCAPEVANAIRGFNALEPGGALPRPDLLIVARGGGSLEDLWGFNEEIVVRAAAESRIPLISAVGHETDTTLIDHAADRRAPTPTAAAELAVPVRMELLAWLDSQEARLSHATAQALGHRRQRLSDMARALPRPESLVAQARQRLDVWEDRLPAALRSTTQARRLRLSEVGAALRPAALRHRVAEARQTRDAWAARLVPALERLIRDRRDRLARRPLRAEALRRDAGRAAGDLERLCTRLSTVSQTQIARWQEKLTALERMRQTLGYTETLRRGYAVVRAGTTVVTTRTQAQQAGTLEVEFQDGRLALGASQPRRRAPKDDSGQGTLL
ncbi:exodeoxyribonuclease VII large subunit [Rhodovulum imhoffii]|uniref:Exodeoxyribonuclease 7 large subunit n=1 Tax=Rhodovulum imhoffii TaxID=365340 RepID=A0A2T5BQR7_9RHOB|nr:exodeoxyribonuclease VII large subunit [Rhodovulum imhoffii]MBK5933888.1 exodeoxyribonuclease VII large subunit [Rhodovulum imhoffii]PTN01524.1 exodeoxyribonuclease VII large subunit [Rhodovulum imhoffii]